jgi:hypothetical protein
MAFTTKYFARFKDIDGTVKEIRLNYNGYDGEPIEWFCSDGSVDIDRGSSDGIIPQNLIVSSQARLHLVLKQKYDLKEFAFDRRTFQCLIVIPAKSDKIEWSGWVEPWNALRPHQKPPYIVELTASCGLAHLSKKRYVNPDNVFRKTGLTLIRECLAQIDSDLSLRVSTHMYENSFTGPAEMGLASFEINTARYYNENGEAMYCEEILQDILQKFNAELTQWDNRWTVRSIVDHATGEERSFHEIPFYDGVPVPAVSWPDTYVINDIEAFTSDGGEISILPPITKYRTEVDLGEQTPYFENGNMVLWTDSGLVGWDFSNMPKGSNGWERYHIGGNPDASSVLKVNGRAPGPYQKKRKKKFGQILAQVLLPGIVSYSKNNTLHVEPSEWIESSVGRISPGDKKITISFDYETDPFSSNILIAIRMPSAINPDVTFWSFPLDENRPASLEYKYIIVPPVNRENIIGKGHIDVSGNPNYPSGRAVNWTYVVYGVPEGQVRRIGGPNGVPVENEDLIISRISNDGGTQAQVGGSWEVINLRTNVKKGTFELPLNFEYDNARPPIPVEEIFVRFYKITEADDKTGDWYKIYNLKGTIEGFVAGNESSNYATTLERGSKTDEEAETINLITGDYNPWYSGALTKPGSGEITSSWRRRPGINEGISIYRAMMLDRLSLTSRPLTVMDGEIKLLHGSSDLDYFHTLILKDLGNMRMRITRYESNKYLRTIKIRAVEIQYENIPEEELRQDSYIPGSRLLNTIPGKGDGIYPTKQDSTNGRIGGQEENISPEEIIESIDVNARRASLFEDIPALNFVAGERGSDSVNMYEYLSKIVVYNDDDQEDEDKFNFDSLQWKVVRKPSWVDSQTVVFMDVTVHGTPTAVGNYEIVFSVTEELTDEELEAEIPMQPVSVEVVIPIKVFTKPELSYKLIDTSGATNVIVGELPGAWPLPAKWDVEVYAKGTHNKYQFGLTGGGPNASAVNENVSETILLSQVTKRRFYEEDNGVVTDAGQFSLSADLYLDSKFLAGETIDFVLYDDEFLDLIKFFLMKGGVSLGELSQAGTSSFLDPETGNFKIEVDGVEHDKAILSFDLTTPVTVLHLDQEGDTEPVTAYSYSFADADFPIAVYGHTLKIELFLAGQKVATRYVHFETVPKSPKPTKGLSLVRMLPNTIDRILLGELPETGGSFDLPTNWNVISDAESTPYDYEKAEIWELRGGGLIKIEVPVYTGQPDYTLFGTPVTMAKTLLFREFNSLNIGNVHSTPSTFRVVFTRRLGGATGQIVAILKADFSFGPAEDIEDVPIKEPGGDVVEVNAGAALSESVVSFIKTLDVRVDNSSIEIFNPATPTQNWLRVKDKGVTLAKLADINGPGLIGRTAAGSGIVSVVPIVSNLTGASNSTIPTSLAVKDAIAEGTTWQAVMTKGSISNIAPVVSLGPATTSANYLFLRPTDYGVGKPQLYIQKTGTADIWNVVLFDGVNTNGTINIAVQNLTHNGIKLVNENRQVLAGTGLTGGGNLATDKTISVVFGTVAGTVSEGNHVHAAATTSVAGFMSAADKIKLNNIATGGDTWGAVMLRGASSNIKPVISINTALTSADYLTLQPTDYSVGKPSLSFSKASVADKWNIFTYDGVGFNGNINFVTGSLTLNEVKLVTETRQVNAGTGLTGGGPLNLDRSLSVVFGTALNTVAQGNHIHAVVTTTVAGFMSASDKVKLNNLPETADTWQTVMNRAAISSIAPTVSVGSAETSANYIFFQPTDWGIGKPRHYLQKASQADKWNWVLWDGSSSNGVINFASSVLTHNDVRLVREDRQINTGTGLNGGGALDVNRTISVNFGTTAGTVAQGNHTHVAAQITDFVNVVRSSLTGAGAISVNAATGVISYTGSASVGGSGAVNYVPVWSSGTTLTNSAIRQLMNGSIISEVEVSRPLGVLENSAFRKDLHVWKVFRVGSNGTDNHGQILIHNDSSYTMSSWSALEIKSTTKVLTVSRMTIAELTLVLAPEGSIAYAADTLGSTAGFFYGRKRLESGSVVWTRLQTGLT